jgi:hypothetical protein
MTSYSETCAAAIGALLCLSVSAPAADHPEGCREDAKRLCQGMQPGGGRIMRCLKDNECKGIEPGQGRVAKCLAEHEDALSAACRQRISEAKEAFAEKHPCHADAKKLCQDVKPGEGRVATCLKQHEGEVSSACKDHLAHRGAAQK